MCRENSKWYNYTCIEFGNISSKFTFFSFIEIQLHINCPKFKSGTMIYWKTCTINILNTFQELFFTKMGNFCDERINFSSVLRFGFSCTFLALYIFFLLIPISLWVFPCYFMRKKLIGCYGCKWIQILSRFCVKNLTFKNHGFSLHNLYPFFEKSQNNDFSRYYTAYTVKMKCPSPILDSQRDC